MIVPSRLLLELGNHQIEVAETLDRGRSLLVDLCGGARALAETAGAAFQLPHHILGELVAVC